MHRPTSASALALAAALLPLGGCQGYERAPLDLPGHARAFLDRTPDSPAVRDFAASLEPSAVEHAAPFDAADGLTLHEVELVALVFNADLRVARLRAGVTEAHAANAGLWEEPVIGLDITRILDSSVRPWEYFGTVTLTLPISGRLELEKQRAGIAHAAELTRVAAQEWSVRMAVRRAWIEWSAAETALEQTHDFVSNAGRILEVVERLEQAGEMARTEARLLRIEGATRQAELAALDAAAIDARRRVLRLMGLAPGAPVELRRDGIGARTGDSEFGADELVDRNPDLRVAATEYEIAEKTLELEVRKQFPDLRLGPGYGTQDGQEQVLIGLSAPIPLLNGNRREIADARARRDLARAVAETTLERLIDAADAARRRASTAAARRRALEQAIVPLVDAQYGDARQLAELGEVNTLVLLESLSRRQDAKLRLIAARKDEAIAAIDLEELRGPEPPKRAPDSLALAPTRSGA